MTWPLPRRNTKLVRLPLLPLTLTRTLTRTRTPNAATGRTHRKSEIRNSKSQTNSKSPDENLRCRQNHSHAHKQIPTTGNAMGGSVLRPGPFLSLVFLSFEFVWDFDIGISDFPFWLRPRAALGVGVRVRVGVRRLVHAARSSRVAISRSTSRSTSSWRSGLRSGSLASISSSSCDTPWCNPGRTLRGLGAGRCK